MLTLLPRLFLAARQDLWLDEIFSLAIASGHSLEQPASQARPEQGDFVEPAEAVGASYFKQFLASGTPPATLAAVMRAVRLSDSSPPLYYLLLHRWTSVFGTSDLDLRAFSLLWAVACIPPLFALGVELGGSAMAFVCCWFYALAPYSLNLGAEGRMYSLAVFFACLAAWLTLKTATAPDNRYVRLLWVLACAAGLWTHYYFSFFWVASVIWLLVDGIRDNRRRVGIVMSALLVVALAAPWYVMLPELATTWRVNFRWLHGFPGLTTELNACWRLAWSHLWVPGSRPHTGSVALLLQVAKVAAVFAIARRVHRGGANRRLLFPVIWLVVACLGPALVDALLDTRTATVSRYGAFAMPATFLLASAAMQMVGPVVRAVAVVVLTCAWASVASPMLVSHTRGSDFRAVAVTVEGKAVGDEVIVVHSIPTGVLGVARYLEGGRPMSSWVGQLGTRRVPRDIERLVAGREGIFWVEIESLREPAPEEAWLKRNARLVESTSLHFGGRVLHFVPQAEERFPAPTAE